MRYYKSSAFSIALAVGVSAISFSAPADAQNSAPNYPWRASAKTQPTASVQSVQTLPSKSKTSFAKPARDLTTVQTIATPTPSFQSMPSVIYDEGKKYVRQGDVYVESPDATTPSAARSVAGSVAQRSFASPSTAFNAKTSFFEKTKSLTGRLNPFSATRSPTAYRAKDWNVPSFSKTLPVFSKKADDPITFAAITPLPAKTSTPSSIDSTQPMFAASESYRTPAISTPARDSQFMSALPTETKITSAVSDSKSQFTPNFSPATRSKPSRDPQVSIFADKPAVADRTASLSADDQFWSPQR